MRPCMRARRLRKELATYRGLLFRCRNSLIFCKLSCLSCVHGSPCGQVIALFGGRNKNKGATSACVHTRVHPIACYTYIYIYIYILYVYIYIYIYISLYIYIYIYIYIYMSHDICMYPVHTHTLYRPTMS